MEKAPVKVWDIVSIVVVILLTLAFFPRITCSETPGGAIEDPASMACIPPEDKSSCETLPSAISEAARTILQVYNECAKTTKDSAVREKFAVLALIMSTGPQAFAVVGPWAFGEGIEEFLQCTWKGWIEAGDGTEMEKELRKEMVDKVFVARDYKNIPKESFEGVKKLLDGDALEAAAKEFGAVADTGEGIMELDKFDNLFRNMSEAYFGIPERVRNYLGDIDKTLSECRFDLATVRAEDAKRLMETYCTSKGTAYRKLEKEVRCYRERNSRILQLQRRGGPQSDRLLVMQEKLNIFRNGMLRDLNLFTSIKQAVEHVNARKAAFAVWQREYKAAGDFALELLRDKDQQKMCEMVETLRKLEKYLQGWTPECQEKICEPFGGSLAGDKYENFLRDNNARIKEDIVANLEEAKIAFKRPCDLKSARTLLKTIETDAARIWEYKGGQCVPGAGEFGDALAAIRATLKEREAADEQVKALLEKARKLAKSECTFDQALTEAIEEEILKNMEKGCAAGEDVSRQIAEIRRLAGQFAMNADAQEQGIAGLINDITVSLDPSVPNCRLDEARKTLNDASEQFRSHLACEAADPAPSQAVRDRAARVRALLGETEQFLEKRTAEVKQAELKYQEALGRILAGTDDACNYKAALSDENVNALSKFAKESCQTEKMSNDLGTVREAISKWDQRIAADLAKMERAREEIRNEPDCAAAEATLRKIKGDTEYLAECEEYKAAVAAALDAMTEAIRGKKENAENAVNQAVAEAEGKYGQCRDLEQAAVDVLTVKDKVPQSCISAEALKGLDAISGKLKKLAEDMKSRATRILELCQNAERAIARCEWSAADEKIAEAQRMFPGEPCYSAQPVFTDLSRRVQSVESNEKTQKDAMDRRRAGVYYKINNARAHIAKSRQPEENPQGQLEAYKTNVGPVENEKKEIERSQELMACLGDLMAEIDAVLAEAAKPAPASPGTGGGFSSAGGGQTQQGGPAAPDKQSDSGFSAAGPGVTKKNDPGNPADGFFAAGVPAITTPLASPDSGGFSTAGSGATSHSDPTAGNDGRSGSRDARPPAASVGTPPSGSTPIIVRPQPFRGDGQPAAVHIFGATSRMGWAGGLAQYSVGPADQSIVEHLMTAGEHVMWANKMDFPPTPAWPGWSEKRSWLQSQANELSRNRTNQYRRQIAGSMSGNYGSMCSELSVQTFGTTQKAANCDAYYCRLGFLMARGQQALLIADEANINRDKQTTDKARADGLSHLSQAIQVLSNYEQVIAVSGRCADLRDVKQMLMNIIRGGNIPDQARAATAAWQTALERISALGQGGPPQPGKYEDCLKKYCPECLQTIDLLGVAKDPKCNDCKRKNEKLINECVAGTPSPVGRPVPPQPSTGGGKPTKTPAQALGTDPGELEGYWVNGGRIYRFVKQGDEYIGSIEHAENEAEKFGIRKGDQVYRIKRLGPNLYKGTYHKRRESVPGRDHSIIGRVDRQEPVWVSVLGVFAFSWGPRGCPTAYLSPALKSRRPQPGDIVKAAPDYLESIGLIRVQNQGGWTMPNGRRVRLYGSDPPNVYWSDRLFPSHDTGGTGTGKPFWFVASGKNPDGKTIFIVFPDYDRWVAAGMNPAIDQRSSSLKNDEYLIDSLSREYLARGGFSIIFGPANIRDITGVLDRYPPDVTGVRR